MILSDVFSRGGIEGGEGVTGGEAWYIENVIEELDIGREWCKRTSTTGCQEAPAAPPPPTETQLDHQGSS